MLQRPCQTVPVDSTHARSVANRLVSDAAAERFMVDRMGPIFSRSLASRLGQLALAVDDPRAGPTASLVVIALGMPDIEPRVFADVGSPLGHRPSWPGHGCQARNNGSGVPSLLRRRDTRDRRALRVGGRTQPDADGATGRDR
jgi:hypothetical protein